MLGHSLEEIRVRALQNILSKLDHGLLTDSDLVQEKHLHIRLLEWFNFSSCVLQEEVLSLILRLTKVSHCATSQLVCKSCKMWEIHGIEGHQEDVMEYQEICKKKLGKVKEQFFGGKNIIFCVMS